MGNRRVSIVIAASLAVVAITVGTVWATMAGAGTHRREGVPDAEENEEVTAGPNSSTGSCGVERWSVKTGTDADASKIALQSTTASTIASLDALTAPSSLPSNNRVQPTETTVFRVAATLTQFKLEADSDYHLVLSDSASHTMIAEIPDPACVGSGSPLAAGITRARAEFDARFTPTGSFQTANLPVTITGVGFFDFQHGQTGVAPNAIELHAVLDVSFGTGAGNTVTVTSPGNQAGTVGSSASLQIHATDSASGQTLTYSATGLPAGLALSPSTALITGTPTTAATSTVTVIATDRTGATGSTTFTWTVTAAGTNCTGQKLGNPGFENGTAPWTASTGVISSNTAEPPHSGTFDAWLDGYGTTHTDTLTQQVTIPAGCQATLTFWLHTDTAETSTTTQFDKLTVTAAGTTLATYTNLDHNTGYTQHTLNLPTQTTGVITLTFTGTEDSTQQTSFVLDDAALTLA